MKRRNVAGPRRTGHCAALALSSTPHGDVRHPLQTVGVCTDCNTLHLDLAQMIHTWAFRVSSDLPDSQYHKSYLT